MSDKNPFRSALFPRLGRESNDVETVGERKFERQQGLWMKSKNRRERVNNERPDMRDRLDALFLYGEKVVRGESDEVRFGELQERLAVIEEAEESGDQSRVRALRLEFRRAFEAGKTAKLKDVSDFIEAEISAAGMDPNRRNH